ncbi:MAG: PilZ domain-containing protein [Acidobacteriia bacterium]|nr:PilZ domain-containing protein [Terriglobia bacterium]
MSNFADKSPAIWPGPASRESSENAGPERRLAQRFPFTAAAEVVDLKSKARVTGRSSDLGLGGCYVDTLAPFAVGAAVQIRLAHGMREIEAAGVVTYALVSMGMGLSFTEIKPEHQSVLKGWIAELSGETAAVSEEPLTDVELEPHGAAPRQLDSPLEEGSAATAGGNRQVLNELINLMVRKRLITEGEAAVLLRQMYR